MVDAPARPTPRPPTPRPRNGPVVLVCLGVTFGMLGAAFASVPFYRWFCSVTGYGGTPSIRTLAPEAASDRRFEVRFDANVFAGLPWRFAPETPSITVRTGEVATVVFRIENLADVETRGQAVFNVAPAAAGYWFTKLACFCFTEQVLQPHEVVEAPVTFFVDPAIDGDKNARGLTALTLSYTFFAAPTAGPRAAEAAVPPPSPRPAL
ncbi:cytochrome c oxidase assembly protein [Siculibacillus lacustris]|uniref:Cytochrome c oxidase assembly protein CtaG n=1 Tax=Siculibacillus lacustris TaxID=1549641 RepID=A0A4Q9VKF3_9HYPH|nr:cytochrome c oxidase assembly protein [Siculibacillus lacustris]TBW34972.1 cytochrome c oxidase assembly protein [Siculibacillus lacustris]